MKEKIERIDKAIDEMLMQIDNIKYHTEEIDTDFGNFCTAKDYGDRVVAMYCFCDSVETLYNDIRNVKRLLKIA